MQIEKLGCLNITKTMSTTVAMALEAILDLPPIHLEVKGKTANEAYRLITTGASKGGQTYGYVSISKFLDKHQVVLVSADRMYILNGEVIRIHATNGEISTPSGKRTFL